MIKEKKWHSTIFFYYFHCFSYQLRVHLFTNSVFKVKLAQNMLYVNNTMSGDAAPMFASLTSALNYVTSVPLTGATIVIMPGQQIVDLAGKITIDRPINISLTFSFI